MIIIVQLIVEETKAKLYANSVGSVIYRRLFLLLLLELLLYQNSKLSQASEVKLYRVSIGILLAHNRFTFRKKKDLPKQGDRSVQQQLRVLVVYQKVLSCHL